MTGASSATSAKKTRMTAPASALRLRPSEPAKLPRTRERDEVGGVARVWSATRLTLMCPSLPGPRPGVEPRGQKVRGEDGDQDRHGDKQEERLHQRKVLVVHGLEQHVADSRIVEDDLDQDRAADDKPQRHREARQVGQDRVPA